MEYRLQKEIRPRLFIVFFLACLLTGFLQLNADAFTLNVVDGNNNPIAGGFRWLLEEDNTNPTTPGAAVSNSISVDIHNSYAPVISKGISAGASVDIPVPDPAKRYFISVLPDAGYAVGGTMTWRIDPITGIPTALDPVTVYVHAYPIPTAQISVFAFADQDPINNGFDETEQAIGGCTIIMSDDAGPLSQDAFGNPLGTVYLMTCDAAGLNPGTGTNACLNPDGSPTVAAMGTGIITTLTMDEFLNGPNPYNLKVGEALVKNIAPGKYGIRLVPPTLDDNGQKINWLQTTTIEGTPTIDAWVKANEPPIFVEGFGTGFKHVTFGFIKTGPATASVYKGQTFDILPWNKTAPAGTATIEGTLRYNHFARPPMNQGFFAGALVPECWVGLNDPTAVPETGVPLGLMAIPCDANSHFVLQNIPPGTYQLVSWDTPLDNLFGFNTVTVTAGQHLDLGNVLVLRWFGTFEGSVFYDANQNGFRNCATPDCNGKGDDVGMMEQNVNIRFRDGSIYQAQPTDVSGEYSFSEVFPFFKWLVVEVDFARYKATGATIATDYGGLVPPANGWIMPSFDKLTPQPQISVNPNTGNNLSRTETGPVLLEGMMLFLNQTNVVDWGKINYAAGENGGISGVVYYDVTRDVNDPRYAAPQPWEPGIPGVQINLYQDFNNDGTPDGPAIDSVFTDSWDQNKPSGCIQNLPVVHGQPIPECADNYGTWNQMRPAVFDGGYAFGPNLPIGTYIVEVVPPTGYELLKEEDKNVDFGDSYVPALLPPPCVGAPHLVPAELSLFPGVPGFFAGQTRPLCDRKQVVVSQGKNAASDFYLFTEVPKAARVVGFALNDLGAEFNADSPIYGEKPGAAWIPVSFRDWAGKELLRVYTDEWGTYNAMLPSTATINVPSPSGVSLSMLTLVLNDPVLPDGSLDPFYNPTYSVTPWTFQYHPGKTSYADTPLVPMTAFAANGVGVDTEAAEGTPVIRTVDGPETGGGPVLCTSRANGSSITITSAGPTVIINPNYNPAVPGSPLRIVRNYGFGNVTGTVTIGGTLLTIDSWTDAVITATVPDPLPTGQLMITRGDSGMTSEIGLTMNIVDCATTNIVRVGPGYFPTIQGAINAATAGSLIVVAPGSYNENVIMNKPVQLQGTGTASTFIDGNPIPLEDLQTWHNDINALGGAAFAAYLLKDPFSESEAPAVIVIGETSYPMGDVQFPDPLCDIYAAVPDPLHCNVLNPGNPFTAPGEARIDGFTLAGSKAGGAVFAVAGAKYLVVSNNDIKNNQGNYAGGIAVGTQDNGFDSRNWNVTIQDNKIHSNGGIQGGGGIVMNEYSNDYLVQRNLIIGNFSRFHGGGIQHRGVSLGNNMISRNRIVFNEDYFNALLQRAGDGGGIHIGGDVLGGTGSGNVAIDSNLIQGNLAGSGHGGGIRAFAVNGVDDVGVSPLDDTNWYRLTITNNMIVNNVAGLAGGGISLQDVARATIVNNTIANNDSTATGILAFTAGQLDSNPQPAGVVSNMHSGALLLLIPAGEPVFSNPVFANNIIWHNRSFYNNHLLNGGAGGLAPRPAGQYWDLQVTETTGTLNPLNSILTSTAGYDPSNISADPAFMSAYTNTLSIATVIDEGGNNINVRFSPLVPNNGNYHITFASPAMNNGSSAYLGLVSSDFDGQARPLGTGVEIGADELPPSANPVITVAVPNGGEAWRPGSTYAIAWNYSGSPGPNVLIELVSQVAGGKFGPTTVTTVLTPSTPLGTGGTGSYLWTIPANITQGTANRIRITDTTNATVTDMSDANFTLSATAPACTYVLNPTSSPLIPLAGGVGSFTVTTQAGCSWTATTAIPWILITSPVGPVVGNGTVNFNVSPNPGAPPRTGSIVVNSQAFTVNQDGVAPPPAITVTSPNGGESWRQGTIYPVQWTYTGAAGPNVMIELLRNGVLDRVIIASTPVGAGGSGSYLWTVPVNTILGGGYTVRVTDSDTPAVTDTSNAAFSIVLK